MDDPNIKSHFSAPRLKSVLPRKSLSAESQIRLSDQEFEEFYGPLDPKEASPLSGQELSRKDNENVGQNESERKKEDQDSVLGSSPQKLVAEGYENDAQPAIAKAEEREGPGTANQDASATPVSAREILTQLYSLLGRAVILPIPIREKGPRRRGWQTLIYAETQTTDYQFTLEKTIERGGSLGVLLGPASDRLVTIDIDDDQLVEQFLELNPWLPKA